MTVRIRFARARLAFCTSAACVRLCFAVCTPTYIFSVVVDDWDMRITRVILGDDQLSNAPRQMNMLAALRVNFPAYLYLPKILGPDGTMLSKVHSGDMSCRIC